VKYKFDAPYWMRDILKNKEFCAVLDSVSAFWRGKNVLWWEDSPYWRLEYLKEDLEHLLLSTSYSKLCKLFMLVVTGADYAESTPGGLLMPDVSVFGDINLPLEEADRGGGSLLPQEPVLHDVFTQKGNL
jgi:hypothetical protein